MIKLANIKPPQIPGPKLNPPHLQILCPYLLRHANFKTYKDKAFRC